MVSEKVKCVEYDSGNSDERVWIVLLCTCTTNVFDTADFPFVAVAEIVVIEESPLVVNIPQVLFVSMNVYAGLFIVQEIVSAVGAIAVSNCVLRLVPSLL